MKLSNKYNIYNIENFLINITTTIFEYNLLINMTCNKSGYLLTIACRCLIIICS